MQLNIINACSKSITRKCRRVIWQHFLLSAALSISPYDNALAQNQPAEDLQHMLALFDSDPQKQRQALLYLTDRDDRTLIQPLIDAFYFREMPKEWDWAVGQLSGKSFGRDWSRWMEWLGQQALPLHRDYPVFKQALFGTIDPSFRQFLHPGHPSEIRIDEIVWGGVKKDGIPSLDHPDMIAANQAEWLKKDEDVFGLAVNGVYHAYPLRILDWHEMLNIDFDGVPITLTYCTLCGAAIPYERQIGDTTFTFGSSGLLYRSNKLMYDRQTHSLWSSMRGVPVVGKLVGQGIELKRHYVVRTTWQRWRAQHPETLVLNIETGFPLDYQKSMYEDYFKSSKTMFPVAWRDKALKSKDWVYGVILNGQPKAYAVKKLQKKSLFHDQLAGTQLVVVADQSELAVRFYKSADVTFVERPTASELTDQTGARWRMHEHQLVREQDGFTLPRLPGHLSYWFGWYAFFPKTEVWKD